QWMDDPSHHHIAEPGKRGQEQDNAWNGREVKKVIDGDDAEEERTGGGESDTEAEENRQPSHTPSDGFKRLDQDCRRHGFLLAARKLFKSLEENAAQVRPLNEILNSFYTIPYNFRTTHSV